MSTKYCYSTTGDSLENVESFADTSFSASWMHTRGINNSIWPWMTRKRQPFTQVKVLLLYNEPFWLKIAGATYQRLSHTEDELVRDIVETFRALRKINMKLNPKKCTFGATEGMFLGYLIEPDASSRVQKNQKMYPSSFIRATMKNVQSLNGKLAV
ncbi:hypothetical protein Tco_1532223 [Tanacetum coccineum]